MESKNFEFLRASHPELASLGGFVERYVHTDPPGALVKLRLFVEQMVQAIYRDLGLPRPFGGKLFDLLTQDTFEASIPPVVASKFHQIRIQGNKAAHGGPGSGDVSLDLLKEAYDLGRWFYLTFAGGKAEDCPPFAPPSGHAPQGEEEALRERRAILRTLAAQEAEMHRLLQELEGARARAAALEKSAAERVALLEAGREAASVLHFDETATRKRLIDVGLASLGWEVGADGQNTEEVGQEVAIPHQPTETGIGYADYVLYRADGKPLAVIEAKKTAKDANVGREQARLYADGLEKVHGFRPVIFYTNGYDVYLWNDAQGEPPRKLYGFYSKDSLESLLHQRGVRREGGPLEEVPLNPAIADRTYQLRCIKEVLERFSAKHRKALIVMATGTGKTRIAISICDALLRAGWAKRILFLCDRKELRKQAKDAFGDHLPGEPLCVVSARTAAATDKRIYLATYPAMMKSFMSYDVGFFDVIIADESHRSIYNRYRDLFQWFDALQIGLTATPRKIVSHNTYRMFGCEDGNPTAHYGFEEAIHDTPPSLVPFEVHTVTTKFLREGIGYWRNLSPEQRRQLEEQMDDAEAVEHTAADIDRQIFNRDTNRIILRNLMDHGIRVGPEGRVGKTIVFARSHKHAIVLQEVFDELYPQYGGNFCRVIDNYDPRAQELIDDFKGIGNNPGLTVAISVDMLDTGVDIPEVVNLVFAKPLKSYVKFWQMIGRGTRLRENLFGMGSHKQKFLVFDHWQNFDYFDEAHAEVENAPPKPLMQQLFETRIELADLALARGEGGIFDAVTGLLQGDIRNLPDKTVAVRERWRDVQAVREDEALYGWRASAVASLKNTIAPLMQWLDLRGEADAYAFDLLMVRMQLTQLAGAGRFGDLKDEMLRRVAELPVNLSQVREKRDVIDQVRKAEFWTSATFDALESVRKELRGVMKYRVRDTVPVEPTVVDVKEDETGVLRGTHTPKLQGLQQTAYEMEVKAVLQTLLETNETLRKIKAGVAVNEADLDALVSLVLTQHPRVNLKLLGEFYPKTAGHLDLAIRRIIGLDAEAVGGHFRRFIQAHPELTAKQIRFLDMVKNHIGKYGAIEIDRLYEAPFTSVHPESIDGVFPEESQVDDLLGILSEFEQPASVRGTRA